MANEPTTICSKHGELAWEGHIVCTGCGALYSTKDASLSTHASYRCANPECRKRMLPHPSMPLTKRVELHAKPFCVVCFDEAHFGESSRDQHGRGDASCKGLECPYHGPQLRKLARRAVKAQQQGESHG